MGKTLPAQSNYVPGNNDWNQLRSHFMSSMLMDVHLHKLARNIGLSWPFKGQDETPAKYIEYEFSELELLPVFATQPSRIKLLFKILKETAAFDQPFQGMIETTAPRERKKEAALHLLKRHDIPPGYPVKFTALSEETKNICFANEAETMADAIVLLQSLAQSVAVNGEVRHLLNSFVQSDGSGIARYLPFHPGKRGLHLVEAIIQRIRTLPKYDYELLASFYTVGNATKSNAAVEAILDRLCMEIEHLYPWFPDEKEEMRRKAAEGDSLKRDFIVAGDPTCEAVAVAVAQRLFPTSVKESRKGLWSRMETIFRNV